MVRTTIGGETGVAAVVQRAIARADVGKATPRHFILPRTKELSHEEWV